MRTLSLGAGSQAARGRVSGHALALGCWIAAVVLALAGHPAASAAERPDSGGTISWAVHEFMSSFDIMYDSSYIGSQPLGPLYNGLVTFDVYDRHRIVGDLAERWEVGDDGTRLTFHLRKGVKFHDGSAFTCADAQWSLDRLARRGNPTYTSVLKPVYASSACPDDFTFVVSLKRPSAGFMTLLASTGGSVMKRGIDEQADRRSPAFLIGTGPFKYKSHTPGVDFQAQRNPNYWKPGLPYLDGYRSVVMSDLTKIFASLRARQITMTGIARHLEKPEADILKRDFPDAVVGIGPRACWDNYVMNVATPPFNDVRVRKAIALATDRDKMIQIAVEGWGCSAGSSARTCPTG